MSGDAGRYRSSPADSVWAGQWVCPSEPPESVVTTGAPLHNPVRCQAHRTAMVPRSGTVLFKIVGYQPTAARPTPHAPRCPVNQGPDWLCTCGAGDASDDASGQTP